MFTQISEIAPVAAVAAAAIWGGFSYFGSGPELADRIANADYVPACEQTAEASIAASYEQQLAAASKPTDIERQGAATGAYMGGMSAQYPEHMQFLDIISGGGFSQSMQVMNGAAQQAQAARQRAISVLEEKREAAIDTAPDLCSCQVKAAFNESQTDWAIFAGTFGLIEQAGVSEFQSLMRANARMCVDRVQS